MIANNNASLTSGAGHNLSQTGKSSGLTTQIPDFSRLAKMAAATLPPPAASMAWGLIVDLTGSRNASRNRLIGDHNLQESTIERLFKLTGSLITAHFGGNHGPLIQTFDHQTSPNAAPIKRFLSAVCESGGSEIASTLGSVLERVKTPEKSNVLLILDTADGQGDTYESILSAVGKKAALFIVHDIYGDEDAQSYAQLFKNLCAATGGEYIPCDQALDALNKILGQAETATKAANAGHPVTPPTSRLAQALAASATRSAGRIAAPKPLYLTASQG